MTREQYQTVHGPSLADFLKTPAGSELINTMAVLRPGISCKQTEHETIFQNGSVYGFETAIHNLMTLSYIPKVQPAPIEASYGAPKETKKAKK